MRPSLHLSKGSLELSSPTSLTPGAPNATDSMAAVAGWNDQLVATRGVTPRERT